MANQPTLPVEAPLSEMESEFIANSPYGLWPENQDSNFGQIRKIICDQLQARVDKIDRLALESFIQTSEDYLSLWEEEYGVPINTAGTVVERRAAVLAQIAVGGFTRARVRYIIQKYLTPLIGGGEAVAFTPTGIPIDAFGIPLYSGVASMIGAFQIYENPQAFSYEVWVNSGLTPAGGMITQIQKITPAGLTVTLDNVHSNVIDYFRMIRTDQPVIYLRLGTNMTDSSGYGVTGTLTGTAAIADPGLLASTQISGGDGARDFNGSSDFGVTTNWNASVIRTNLFKYDIYSIEVILRPDALSALMTVFGFDTSGGMPTLRVGTDGKPELYGEGVGSMFKSNVTMTAGQKYLVQIRRNGDLNSIAMRINGVPVTGVVGSLPGPGANVITTELQLGRRLGGTQFWNGGIDEFALYDLPLTDAQFDRHYNAYQNIQTLG